MQSIDFHLQQAHAFNILCSAFGVFNHYILLFIVIIELVLIYEMNQLNDALCSC